MMEISGETYQINYDAATATITWQGIFRLQGTSEYAPIVALLDQAAATGAPVITLNLTELQFLNSSGINTLSKFVIKVRNQGESQIVVFGNHEYSWQTKSLKNFQRLMPGLTLQINA